MYKCRICGKEYNHIEDVINCEQNCLSGIKNVKKDNNNDIKPCDNKILKNNEIEKKISDIQSIIQDLKTYKSSIEIDLRDIKTKIQDYQKSINMLNNEKDDFLDTLKSIDNDIYENTKELENLQKLLSSNNIENQNINKKDKDIVINIPDIEQTPEFKKAINDILNIIEKFGI